MNTDALVEVLFRWGHAVSGITWIGLLYFFNLVNGPFQAKLDLETRAKVVPELMPRALWWFRWSAMATLVFGLALFFWLYVAGTGLMRTPDGQLSGRALYIMWGMTFAFVMWFNVWFLIWPAQREIIAAVRRGQAPPADLARRAFLASRYNTYSAAPMLFMMFLAPHGQADFDWLVFLAAVVLGVGLTHLALRAASRVGIGP